MSKKYSLKTYGLVLFVFIVGIIITSYFLVNRPAREDAAIFGIASYLTDVNFNQGQDANIYSRYPKMARGSSPDNLVIKDSREYLLQFNMDFPENHRVESANLKLYVYKQASRSTIRLSKILKPWDAAKVTWNDLGNSIEGVDTEYVKDFVIDPATLTASSATSPSGNGWITIDITSIVQDWADGEPNYGLLFEAASSTDRTHFFGLRYPGKGPLLDVVFREVVQEPEPVTIEQNLLLQNAHDVSLYAGYPDIARGPRTDNLIGGNYKYLLEFDRPEIANLVEVQSAIIRLYVYRQPADVNLKLYQVFPAWSSATATWNSPWAGPGVTAESDRTFVRDFLIDVDQNIEGNNGTGWLSIDVTDYVNDWLTNGNNSHGLLFEAGQSDRVQAFGVNYGNNLNPKMQMTVKVLDQGGDGDGDGEPGPGDGDGDGEPGDGDGDGEPGDGDGDGEPGDGDGDGEGIAPALRLNGSKDNSIQYYGLQPGAVTSWYRYDAFTQNVPANMGEIIPFARSHKTVEGGFGVGSPVNMDVKTKLIRTLGGKAGKEDWYAMAEQTGYLWIGEAGEYTLSLNNVDDVATLLVNDQLVLDIAYRYGGNSGSVKLPMRPGFYKIKLRGVNTTYTFSNVLSVQFPDGTTRNADSDLVYHAGAVTNAPKLDTTALVGVPYNYQFEVSGGRAPYNFAVSGGSLPRGLSLNPNGTISGRATEAAGKMFTLSVTDANGVTATSEHYLPVKPFVGAHDKNDKNDFLVTFEDTDPNTLVGGLINGRSTISGGLNLLGDYSFYQFHPKIDPSKSTTAIANRGAGNSLQSMKLDNVPEFGFYLSGQQYAHLGDFFPAVREANRYSFMVQMPETVIVNGITYNYNDDPVAYQYSVLDTLHMAGHNTTRYVGHNYEDNNWHFYHLPSAYWPDYWKASEISHIGDRWFLYITSDQNNNQRSGPGKISGFFNPMEDRGQEYFDTMNRQYSRINLSENVYSNLPVFYLDNVRYYREDPKVEIATNDGQGVYRKAISLNTQELWVPFKITNRDTKALDYFFAQTIRHANLPTFSLANVYLDVNGNGQYEQNDALLSGEKTPVFQPGETKYFLYKINAAEITQIDFTEFYGLTVRARDAEDPFTFNGDTLQVLLYKTANPDAITEENIYIEAKTDGFIDPANPDNREPAVNITSHGNTLTVAAGTTVTFTATVSDSDGPRAPELYWTGFDNGNEQVKYGSSVSYTFSRPGTYEVRANATDAVHRPSFDAVLVTVR